MKKTTGLFIFLFLDVLLVIGGVWWFLRHTHFFEPHNSSAPVLTQQPSVTHLSLAAGEVLGDYRLYSLPGDLSQAKINDIVFAAGSMWLGTNKGLVNIKGSQVTVYKQFSNWPFEWIGHVAVTPYGLAVNTLVAEHNYGGKYAGSYLFDIQHATWRRLGGTVLAQAWLDGYLYQASSELVRRGPAQSWQKQVVLPRVCKYKLYPVSMRAINGELWLTGDSPRPSGHGCGVIRYNPETGKSVAYDTQAGLNNNKGWDIGGDAAAVFVAHAMNSAYLSRFDLHNRTWQPLRAGGSGNHISVTPQAVWLAALSRTQPIIRIDRNTAHATVFPALGDKEYVSAIAAKDKEVWFATYVTNWQGQGFTIRSRLGRYIDRQ